MRQKLNWMYIQGGQICRDMWFEHAIVMLRGRAQDAKKEILACREDLKKARGTVEDPSTTECGAAGSARSSSGTQPPVVTLRQPVFPASPRFDGTNGGLMSILCTPRVTSPRSCH